MNANSKRNCVFENVKNAKQKLSNDTLDSLCGREGDLHEPFSASSDEMCRLSTEMDKLEYHKYFEKPRYINSRYYQDRSKYLSASLKLQLDKSVQTGFDDHNCIPCDSAYLDGSSHSLPYYHLVGHFDSSCDSTEDEATNFPLRPFAQPNSQRYEEFHKNREKVAAIENSCCDDYKANSGTAIFTNYRSRSHSSHRKIDSKLKRTHFSSRRRQIGDRSRSFDFTHFSHRRPDHHRLGRISSGCSSDKNDFARSKRNAMRAQENTRCFSSSNSPPSDKYTYASRGMSSICDDSTQVDMFGRLRSARPHRSDLEPTSAFPSFDSNPIERSRSVSSSSSRSSSSSSSSLSSSSSSTSWRSNAIRDCDDVSLISGENTYTSSITSFSWARRPLALSPLALKEYEEDRAQALPVELSVRSTASHVGVSNCGPAEVAGAAPLGNSYCGNSRRRFDTARRHEDLPLEFWERSEECRAAKSAHMDRLDDLIDSRERLVLLTTLWKDDIVMETNMFPCKYLLCFHSYRMMSLI